jgi:rod shape-determining protein MreC
MKRKQTLVIGVVCGVALIIIALKYAGGFWPFRAINDSLLNPLGSSVASLGRGFKQSFEILTKATELSKQNKQQSQEILELKNQLATLKEIANENEQLRNQLKFNEQLSFDLTAARVVSSEGTSLRKYATIDRGKSSGLSSGMAVIASGVLVGTIDKVEEFSSTIFLSTDPEFRIRAIGQDGRAQGIVKGQLGQGYLFDKITQAESINNSELVITAGSGAVPKGVLIGQVESVQKSDNAVFQSATLRPLVDFSDIDVVFVITGLKK